jgi:hypothetical protein
MDHIIRKKKKEKQKRVYFSKDTEAAIIRYNHSTNPEEKSEIYQNYIHWPFYKLTENIIHTFKFYHTDGVENLEDLQHEIMTFLLSKIHLFNPDKGAKAYSYFGTIVKRWLIIYNQNNYKKKINSVSFSNLSYNAQLDTSDSPLVISKHREKNLEHLVEEAEFSDKDITEEEDYKYEDRLSMFIDHYIEYVTSRIYEIFPKSNDAQIADAILELFRKRDNIDVFNKKALYIYIREMVDVKTPKITKIANRLYVIFKEKYLFYLEHGYFPQN